MPEAESKPIAAGPEAEAGAGEAGAQAAPPEHPAAARLASALAAAALPAWRKAYLSDILASGRKFDAAGNARGADYCFAKVEAALGDLSAGAPGGAETAAPEPARPADRVRSRWRHDRLADAEKVLDSHGSRLSSLERQSYRERLARLRQDSAQPAQAAKADQGLLDLRRRLYGRVLKSQKISLLRRRAPGARPPLPARISATAAAWQPITGPYNDRSNLEEAMAVIAAADPAWVEEFLELYGGLFDLNAFLAAGAVPKKG